MNIYIFVISLLLICASDTQASVSAPVSRQSSDDVKQAEISLLSHSTDRNHFGLAQAEPYPVISDLSGIDRKFFRTSALIRLFAVKAFDQAEYNRLGELYTAPILSQTKAAQILQENDFNVTTINAATIKQVAFNCNDKAIKNIHIFVDFSDPDCLDLCHFGNDAQKEAGKKALYSLRQEAIGIKEWLQDQKKTVRFKGAKVAEKCN